METKSLLQSTTIWGVILAALSSFVDLAPQLQLVFQPGVAKYIAVAAQIAGFLLVVFGRAKATAPLSGILTPKGTPGGGPSPTFPIPGGGSATPDGGSIVSK